MKPNVEGGPPVVCSGSELSEPLPRERTLINTPQDVSGATPEATEAT